MKGKYAHRIDSLVTYPDQGADPPEVFNCRTTELSFQRGSYVHLLQQKTTKATLGLLNEQHDSACSLFFPSLHEQINQE